MKKILVTEDDLLVREMINEWLSERYDVIEAQNGTEALEYFNTQHIDAAILDWMMPGINGIELTKQIRKNNPGIPIIMVTARTDDDSIEKAFRHGVSDFLKKPFSFKELETRLARFLIEETPFHLDEVKNSFSYNGETLFFTNKEFLVLKLLLERPGRIVTKDEISKAVWGYAFDGTRNIDVTIHKIKAKIKNLGVEILTKRGQGYYIETI